MIFKEIYLYPDRGSFDKKAVVYPIQHQSRSLCAYLERRLKKTKFKSNGFNRICFVGQKNPKAEGYINSCNVLRIEISFDEKSYRTKKENELNPFFIKMLEEGIEKCEKQYEIPGDELRNWIEDFRNENYINHWVFKTRLFRSIGLKCSLICDLTIHAFHMRLMIMRGKVVIFNKEIKNEVPNEFVFNYLLKDIKLINDKIVVIGKLDDTVFEIPVQELNVH